MQLSLFQDQSACEFVLFKNKEFPHILFDMRVGDHVCRAVTGSGLVRVYHGSTGPGLSYNANLQAIDEVPGRITPQGISEALSLGLATRVWSRK